jgi:hypothetical protein
VKRTVIALVALVRCSGAAFAASREAPEGVQEIAGQLGNPGHRMKNCAFWANEAAAAGRSRNLGIKEDAAENSIPFPMCQQMQMPICTHAVRKSSPKSTRAMTFRRCSRRSCAMPSFAFAPRWTNRTEFEVKLCAH